MRLRTKKTAHEKIIIIGLTDIEHFLHGSAIYTREVYQLLLQVLQSLEVRAVLFDVLFEYPKPYDSTIALKFQEVPSFISYKFLTADMPFEELEGDMDSLDFSLAKTGERDFETSETIADSLWNTLDFLDLLNLQLAELEANQDKSIEQRDHEAGEITQKINKTKFLLSRLSRDFLEETYGLPCPSNSRANPHEEKFVILPAAQLMLNARGVGFINIIKEKEDVVRRVPLLIRYKENLYPHLDLVFLCDYYGVELSDLKIEFGKFISFAPTKNFKGIKRIPIDRAGNVLINFREDKPAMIENSFSLHQVLHYGRYQDRFPTRIKPEAFKDAVVIIGDMSPGGADVEPIPLSPAYPMVGIHASLISMVWNDDYMFVPARGWDMGITIILGLLIGILFGFTEYRQASLATLLGLGAYLGLCVYLSSSHSVFIPLVRPVGTIAGSYVFLIFYILGVKERERRRVKSVFLKSVSPHIGEEILRQYDNEAIWGLKKEVTILFVDIRGFTPLSEALSARELVDFLDAYYDTISQIIFSHDGVVNKFVGDAVLALFGAPLELPDAEARAIKAAIDIQNAMEELNRNPSIVKITRTVSVGIGISTGEVVVGTVGRKKIRIEYTALGDTVNIADRLQGNAKPGEILINRRTYEKVQQSDDPYFASGKVHFEELSPMMLKGKGKPVDVFRVDYRNNFKNLK